MSFLVIPRSLLRGGFIWLEERIYRIETDEGFDLADLLHELAILELKALGDTKHGAQRF